MGAADSPFASIRELHDAEARIMVAITGVESAVLAAISAESERHDTTHAEMRRIGNERHGPINDFLEAAKLHGAQSKGMWIAASRTVQVLRLVNEFRWLIVAAFLGVGLVLGNFHVDLGVR
jgi:hypothetical protein